MRPILRNLFNDAAGNTRGKVLGIYSVLSYFVVSRRKEIGVRMAVGASCFQIYRLAAGSAGTPIVIGIALGLSSAIAGSRLIERFGVDAARLLDRAPCPRRASLGRPDPGVRSGPPTR